MRRLRVLLVLMLVAALATPLHGITTVEIEVVCPICKTKNTFYDYASWGSYVYHWPSKFQYLFWPRTDSAALYSCKKCHLTLFMWDFKEFPAEKIEEARRALAGVKLLNNYTSYTEIPGSEKLAIAERVYVMLGKDDDFWAEFYRLQGYYLVREKKPTEARVARVRALAITENMLSNEENDGRRKELLLISGAMRHFLDDDEGALRDLEAAATLKFVDKGLEEAQSNNVDAYLSSLIAEYIQGIKEKKIPADDA